MFSILTRLGATLSGVMLSMLIVFLVALSANHLYDLNYLQWFLDFCSTVTALASQYWFYLVMWFLIMILWGEGLFQLVATLIVCFNLSISYFAFTPQIEKDSVNALQQAISTNTVQPLSYQCNNLTCEVDSIQIPFNDKQLTLSVYHQDFFKQMMKGQLISVDLDEKDFKTNNARLVKEFNQARKQLGSLIYLEKLKEEKDKVIEVNKKLPQ